MSNTFTLTDTRPNDALSLTELSLYHMLMDYRDSLGLDPIPLSTALTATAGRHADDTLYNIWDAGVTLPDGANLHSWSDAYYYGDHSVPENMWYAPARIGIDYPSAGYEISAAGYSTISQALTGWQGSPGHDNVITNSDIWAGVTYSAIGVGVGQDSSVSTYGGNIYHVWFGASTDPAGAPTINGTGAADSILGTDFADTITGGNGADSVNAADGADAVWAGSGDTGNDTYYGGDGNDTLGSGAGSDSLYGETGNDVLYGGTGGDYLSGGSGDDTAWSGNGNDTILGEGNADIFGGGGGADSLVGGSGNDTIYGAAGTDVVDGSGGNDEIYGGDGGDTLTGGAGNDSIFGGSGNDTLIFGTGHGDDFVGAFETKGDNTIDLSALNVSGFGALGISQSGADVVIDTGQGTITLWNTSTGDVTAGDFLF